MRGYARLCEAMRDYARLAEETLYVSLTPRLDGLLHRFPDQPKLIIVAFFGLSLGFAGEGSRGGSQI
eukprot:11118252-Prorocentrum_lima.AAC.1